MGTTILEAAAYQRASIVVLPYTYEFLAESYFPAGLEYFAMPEKNRKRNLFNLKSICLFQKMRKKILSKKL